MVGLQQEMQSDPSPETKALLLGAREALTMFDEARAALLEEGINIDRLPMLTDMRPPEEREPN